MIIVPYNILFVLLYNDWGFYFFLVNFTVFPTFVAESILKRTRADNSNNLNNAQSIYQVDQVSPS